MTHTRAGAGSLAVVLAVTLLGLAGCWDMIDIEQRAFVDAVGIDVEKAPPRAGGAKDSASGSSPLETQEPEDIGLGGQQTRIVITAELPIVSQLAGGGIGGGGGGGGGVGGGKPGWVVSSSGSTLFEANRELATISNRRLFYGHLKTIIIGEEAARAGIQPLLDFFERGREPLQRAKVAVSMGPARKALEINPKLEKLAGTYINTLLLQHEQTSRILETDLGRFLSEVHNHHNSVLPRIVPGKDQVKAVGSAVFKHYRLVGWLGEVETRGLMFLLKRAAGGVIVVAAGPDGKTKGAGLTGYEVSGSWTSIRASIEKGQPVFHVRIHAEGNIAEETGMKRVASLKMISAVERKASQEIEREVRWTLRKLQKEFKVDVVGFGDVLHKNYPDQWRKWKDGWDDKYFPKVRADIVVDARVRRVGTTD